MKTDPRVVADLTRAIVRVVIAEQGKARGHSVDGKAHVDVPSALSALAAAAAGFVSLADGDEHQRLLFEAHLDAEVLAGCAENRVRAARYPRGATA